MALALEVQGNRIREGEGSSGSLDGADRGQDSARLGRLLQSRGDVDDIARHEALIEAGGGRGENVARVDSDSNRQPDPVRRFELLIERLESRMAVQSGVAGSGGVG